MINRITILIDLCEDVSGDCIELMREDIHAALDECGTVKGIKYEDEHCISENKKREKDLQSENARLKAERDKAVEDIKRIFSCGASCIICSKCKMCDSKDYSIGFCKSFEWRGLEETDNV